MRRVNRFVIHYSRYCLWLYISCYHLHSVMTNGKMKWNDVYGKRGILSDLFTSCTLFDSLCSVTDFSSFTWRHQDLKTIRMFQERLRRNLKHVYRVKRSEKLIISRHEFLTHNLMLQDVRRCLKMWEDFVLQSYVYKDLILGTKLEKRRRRREEEEKCKEEVKNHNKSENS